jgi:hypothetical protein
MDLLVGQNWKTSNTNPQVIEKVVRIQINVHIENN